mmetsp:Transcript_4980/g.12407  ORF Transcript_4980/g.12407 Transcript_4980/m.12407 type:complete len:341 (+) Transcript_4980:395-1417(+)
MPVNRPRGAPVLPPRARPRLPAAAAATGPPRARPNLNARGHAYQLKSLNPYVKPEPTSRGGRVGSPSVRGRAGPVSRGDARGRGERGRGRGFRRELQMGGTAFSGAFVESSATSFAAAGSPASMLDHASDQGLPSADQAVYRMEADPYAPISLPWKNPIHLKKAQAAASQGSSASRKTEAIAKDEKMEVTPDHHHEGDANSHELEEAPVLPKIRPPPAKSDATNLIDKDGNWRTDEVFVVQLPRKLPMVHAGAMLEHGSSLPLGKIGKLQVYKSGKIKMVIGEVVFDVSFGTRFRFAQRVGVFSNNAADGDTSVSVIQDVAERPMIVTPDFGLLVKAHQR